MLSVHTQNNLQSMKRWSDPCVLPCDFVFEPVGQLYFWSVVNGHEQAFPFRYSPVPPCLATKHLAGSQWWKGCWVLCIWLSEFPTYCQGHPEKNRCAQTFPPNHENNTNKAHISKFPWRASQVVKNPPANAGDADVGPGSGRSPGEGNGNPLIFLPGKPPGQRRLAGHSQWGHKELDKTEWAHSAQIYLVEEKCLTLYNHSDLWIEYFLLRHTSNL